MLSFFKHLEIKMPERMAIAKALTDLADTQDNLLEQNYFALKQMTHWGFYQESKLKPTHLKYLGQHIGQHPGSLNNESVKKDVLFVSQHIQDLNAKKDGLYQSRLGYILGLFALGLISIFAFNASIGFSSVLALSVMNLCFFPMLTIAAPLLTFFLCENIFTFFAIQAAITAALSLAIIIGYNIECNHIEKKLDATEALREYAPSL
jgi:hypothetical protein